MAVSSYRNVLITDRAETTPLEGIIVGVLLSTLLWTIIGLSLKWVLHR